MKLSERLLNKLVDDPMQGRHVVAVSEETTSGWAAGLTVNRADVVGCIIWELTLQCRGAEYWNTDALTARSQHIAESVTGLIEPLKVIEVDSLRREAMLRSDAPTERAADLFYYEVKLQPQNTISVRRFRGSHAPGEKRDQVPFSLTHEAIGKLVDDLTA